eukprot:scaffold110063_cov55-Attheya_sp.AAC.3
MEGVVKWRKAKHGNVRGRKVRDQVPQELTMTVEYLSTRRSTPNHQGPVQSGNEMSSTIFCLASRSFCPGIQYLRKHP